MVSQIYFNKAQSAARPSSESRAVKFGREPIEPMAWGGTKPVRVNAKPAKVLNIVVRTITICIM